MHQESTGLAEHVPKSIEDHLIELICRNTHLTYEFSRFATHMVDSYNQMSGLDFGPNSHFIEGEKNLIVLGLPLNKSAVISRDEQ